MKTPGVEARSYGLGLAWRDTSCGVRVYGNDGDALAYQSWSFSTEDAAPPGHGRPHARLHAGDPDDAVDAFLDKAFCG